MLLQVKFLMDHKMPAINRAFQHFLVHTGSRGVLEGLTQRPLSISEAQLAPARKTLAKFGNTSAASTWCAAHWRKLALTLHPPCHPQGQGMA